MDPGKNKKRQAKIKYPVNDPYLKYDQYLLKARTDLIVPAFDLQLGRQENTNRNLRDVRNQLMVQRS